jgi:hypothetical protein
MAPSKDHRSAPDSCTSSSAFLNVDHWRRLSARLRRQPSVTPGRDRGLKRLEPSQPTESIQPSTRALIGTDSMMSSTGTR